MQNTFLSRQVSLFDSSSRAKPCLKWAGGKSQLLSQIELHLPKELFEEEIHKYAEPFVGGGAVFFYIAQTYDLDELYISDINEELILLYTTIQNTVEELSWELLKIEQEYLSLDQKSRKEYFYRVRADFNDYKSQIDFDKFTSNWIQRASQIIFLNRTCFNGLFRVNSKSEFNVPFGDYKNPRICDYENLLAVSRVLSRTKIVQGDFTACQDFTDSRTFVYFDPPYRPISKTASFNAYSKNNFGDREQIRLAKFCRKLHDRGVKWMLSNSDPKNKDPDDNFFEKLYADFYIHRAYATRMINSDATKRSAISELLIKNY